ncbi:hypothetical protein RI543_001318 [Arxiozyma heterogenica]|uniref:AMP-activated protein kinase glycogen-binding domain-containing protein n=1 Tax=Arxiozyma heterogenica TaxID=278026 RepID=A0AAN7ZYD5_9SACH|nr:hypothetical protein RI543_001318 [Kazachstania heterogenica]
MPHTTNFTFTWPAGPNDVIVTGTFDDWKGSIPLVKLSSGSFEISVPFTEPPEDEDDTIYFKFIVDGDWTVSDEYAKTSDGCGFENNYIRIRDIIATNKLIKNKVKIPEAGGLTAATTNTTTSQNAKADSNNNTVHILPITQPSNNQNTFLGAIGGPGPVVPESAQNIQEFSEIRDVNTTELNNRLNKELKNKTKSEDPSNIMNKEQIRSINRDTSEHRENINKHDEIDQPQDSNINIFKPQPRENNEDSYTIESGTPNIQSETIEKFGKESEPITVEKSTINKTHNNPTTNITQVEGNTKNVKNDTSNKNPTKQAASSENKTKEEQKKPKKGFLGRLKKMFT